MWSAVWFVLPRHRWIICVWLLLLGGLVGYLRAEVAKPPKIVHQGTRVIRVDRPSDPASQARGVITGWMERVIPKREAGLYAGMLYGNATFSKDDKAMYRDAGLTHLVAVSGSNVAMVLEAILFVAVATRLRASARFYISMIAISSFAMFAGMSSSVARAGWLACLSLYARHLGRLPHPAHLLLVVASGMAMLDPWIVRYDAGYALSFCAGWGMIVWSPLIVDWLPESFAPWLKEAIAGTTAATATTTTYLLYAFRQFTPYSLIANVLAAPMVPVAMGVSALSVVIGALRLPASLFISSLLWPAIWIETVADWVSSFPGAHVLAGSWWWQISAVVWLLAEWWRKNRGKQNGDISSMQR